MAEENNNEHRLTGTLYSKLTRRVVGTKAKNKGKEFEFYYYIVEAQSMIRKTEAKDDKINNIAFTKKDLVKFSLPYGMSIDEFDIGDPVDIAFTITGREWTNKEGVKDVINENKITYIRFADIKTDEGKPKKDMTFVPPQFKPASESSLGSPDVEDDLPFIWTILIGLGMLLPQAQMLYAC